MWRFFAFLLLCLFCNAVRAFSKVNIQLCRVYPSPTAQHWQYNQDDHSIRPLHSQLCLTTHKNQSSKVSISPCVPGLNFYQVWSLNPQDGNLVALNGKCLGAHYRNLLKSSVEITSCTGGNNQHWIWKNITGGIIQTKWPWKHCLTVMN